MLLSSSIKFWIWRRWKWHLSQSHTTVYFWPKQKGWNCATGFREYFRFVRLPYMQCEKASFERPARTKATIEKKLLIDFIHEFFRRINIGFELERFFSVKIGQSLVISLCKFHSLCWQDNIFLWEWSGDAIGSLWISLHKCFSLLLTT